MRLHLPSNPIQTGQIPFSFWTRLPPSSVLPTLRAIRVFDSVKSIQRDISTYNRHCLIWHVWTLLSLLNSPEHWWPLTYLFVRWIPHCNMYVFLHLCMNCHSSIIQVDDLVTWNLSLNLHATVRLIVRSVILMNQCTYVCMEKKETQCYN